MLTIPILILVLLGVVAGALGALLGLGGSIILVPVLVLVFGFPMTTAVGAGLVCVIATSCSGAAVYVQRNWVDVRLGISLQLVTVLGAISGALVVAWLPVSFLQGLFGVVLLYAVIAMARRAPQPSEEAGETIPGYRVRNLPLGLGGGYVVGSVAGLLGIGGGPLQVPLLHLGLGLPLKMATATSNFIMGMTATAGAVFYFGRGEIIVALAAPLVLGVFLGAQAGARLARRVHSRVVQILLLLVLAVLAAFMLAEAFGYRFPWRGEL